uniref:glutamate-rich protein 6 n=1 Tax=Pristiophorus japonicus TaxID=55135 RepID=UPI00398ED04D
MTQEVEESLKGLTCINTHKDLLKVVIGKCLVEHLDQNFVVNELDKAETAIKCRAILLTVCESSIYGRLKNRLASVKQTDKSYTELCTLCRNTRKPKESILMAREVEFSGATEFTSDVTPSLTHQEGEAEHQREFTATQSQTVWTSLNTPGSSLTEVQKEIPKGLKAQLLEIPSDAGDERKQKTKSGESDIENLTDQSDVDYRTQLMISSTNATICEYCHQIRLPFPDPAELDFKGPEEVLMNRDENPDLEEIPSEHPGFYLTELEINEAKAKLAKRIKISEVTMYMTSIEIGDKIVFTHSKTISYKLSSEYCSKQGWTLRPRIAVHSAYEDLSLYVPSAQSYKELKRRLEIVEKYYPNGQKFLTRFPDGTGNVFYPSGNIAIVISAFHQTQLVYIILQDMAWNAKFLGIFRSNGQGTCYLPNGLIWINVTPLCGSYFTEQGLTKKQWQWRDYYHHVHAPPYQSISLKLNSYINIRVISRDQIYTTFETKKRNVRFNMGAKLVLRDLEHFHAMSKVTREEKYLNKVNQKIHKILEQIQHL